MAHLLDEPLMRPDCAGTKGIGMFAKGPSWFPPLWETVSLRCEIVFGGVCAIDMQLKSGPLMMGDRELCRGCNILAIK